MIIDKNIARKTAELLMQINAIKLSPNEPFTWASGWKSPIYCDNRIVLSYPVVRNYIREQMANHIEDLDHCIIANPSGFAPNEIFLINWLELVSMTRSPSTLWSAT